MWLDSTGTWQHFTVEQMKDFYREIPRFRELLNYDKLIARVIEQDEIISLVNKLNWNFPEYEQKDAIKILKNIVHEDDYDLLIISGHKYTWPNTVEILKEAGYPKNRKALPSLILLLQDINWPGAREGMSVLKESDKKVLIPMLEIAIEEAYNTNDVEWLTWIKEFLEFAEINKADFVNCEVYGLLKHANQ